MLQTILIMIRQFFILVVCVLPCLNAFAQNPNPDPDIDLFIYEEMLTENIAGLSSVVVKDGEIVWLESYGKANVDADIDVSDSTIFLLASVSKLFAATSMMQLVEQGSVEVTDPINDYLPFEVFNPNFPDEVITIEMLLLHTSGIRDNFDAMENYYSVGDPTIPLETVIERYFSVDGEDYDANQNFYNEMPGVELEYTNMGFALLGYLVERISETNFSDYSNQNTLEPLCMSNSAWFLADLDTNQVAHPHEPQGSGYEVIPHYGFADYPNGLLRANVIDLANFMIAYLQNGQFNDEQILEAETVDVMLTQHIPDIDSRQGYGWYRELLFPIGGGSVFWVWGHNGGEQGVSTDLYIDPENNIGIAILNNGDHTNLFIADVLYDYGIGLETQGVGNPACTPPSSNFSISDEAPIHIYPNPTSERVWVESTAVEQIFLYDLLGRLVSQIETKADKTELVLPETGVFFIKCETQDGGIQTYRVVRK